MRDSEMLRMPSSSERVARVSVVVLMGLLPIVVSALPSCGGGAGTCGDAVVDEGEECDDGNLEDTDDCTTKCLKAACHDGFVQAGIGEECDVLKEDDPDGDPDVDTDGCTPECKLDVCGDGVLDQGVEECDDG